MAKIRTVLGEIDATALGQTLPHEHLLVGFDPKGVKPDQYDDDVVVAKMLPHLKALYDAGCRAFVECTPIHLGRDMKLWQRFSRESGLHIIAPTGAYKEPNLPPYAYVESPEQMAARWIAEATDGVDSVMPGFIKIAMSGEPISRLEGNILEAALMTSNATGLVIACHCAGAEGMLDAMARMQETGFDTERFIWVHTDTTFWTGAVGEAVVDLAIQRGLWIELDCIGTRPYDEHIALINKLWSLGMRMLISQDAGFYNVDAPDDAVRPFVSMITDLLPQLPPDMVNELMYTNPAEAFRIR